MNITKYLVEVVIFYFIVIVVIFIMGEIWDYSIGNIFLFALGIIIGKILYDGLAKLIKNLKNSELR